MGAGLIAELDEFVGQPLNPQTASQRGRRTSPAAATARSSSKVIAMRSRS
jgi:hypothetical protein